MVRSRSLRPTQAEMEPPLPGLLTLDRFLLLPLLDDQELTFHLQLLLLTDPQELLLMLCIVERIRNGGRMRLFLHPGPTSGADRWNPQRDCDHSTVPCSWRG